LEKGHKSRRSAAKDPAYPFHWQNRQQNAASHRPENIGAPQAGSRAVVKWAECSSVQQPASCAGKRLMLEYDDGVQ